MATAEERLYPAFTSRDNNKEKLPELPEMLLFGDENASIDAVFRGNSQGQRFFHSYVLTYSITPPCFRA